MPGRSGPTIITSVLLLGSARLWPLITAIICVGTLLTAVIARRATATEYAARQLPCSPAVR